MAYWGDSWRLDDEVLRSISEKIWNDLSAEIWEKLIGEEIIGANTTTTTGNTYGVTTIGGSTFEFNSGDFVRVEYAPGADDAGVIPRISSPYRETFWMDGGQWNLGNNEIQHQETGMTVWNVWGANRVPDENGKHEVVLLGMVTTKTEKQAERAAILKNADLFLDEEAGEKIENWHIQPVKLFSFDPLDD